jgi:multimeric flavodoxin WrbA
MNILAILGSPRKNGNTSELLNKYLEGIKENYKDVSVDEIFLQGEKIRPCTACNSCKKGDGAECKINDDMQKYYKKVENANLLIFATPVYWFNMSAQTKIFIDRLYALNFKKFPADKKLVLLMTFGDKDEKLSGAVNVINIFKYFTDFLKMDFVQHYGTSSEMGPAKKMESLEEVYSLGKKLIL